MALTNSIEHGADTRLRGATETAKTFHFLNARQEQFTPEEREAYHKLRDAVMDISGESPEPYLQLLTKYFDAAPQTQAPEITPTPINDNAAPASPVAPIEVAAAPVPEVPDIPAPSFMSRDRVGTPFNAPPANPEPALAQKPEEKEVPAEVKLEVASQEVPKEEPKVAADLMALREPGAADVVATIQEKVAEVVTPSVERPSNIEAAAKEIESINETLNEFGGWKALQWIHNPQTGYRTYMKKLIEARSAVAKARSGEANPDLTALTSELSSLADGVRRAVKGEGQTTAPEVAAPVAEAVPVISEPIAPVMETPVVHTETPVITPATAETPVPLRVETAAPEAVAWSHQVPEPQAAGIPEAVAPVAVESSVVTQAAPVVENIAAVLEGAAPAPQEAQALNIHELPRVTTMPASEQTVPVPPEVPPQPEAPQAPEAESGADLTALYEPGAAAVTTAVQEQAAAPQSIEKPTVNQEIYSPKVKEELNRLLTEWLGHTGWILHKEGLEHPDWHRMAPLTVREVMEAAKNGENHAGLQATMVDNLASNLRKWGELYGISMLQHEDTTIDEIMHRVVFEYLKP